MKKNKGFSLIELLVAVAVFAIMMAVAAPNLQDFTKRNRLSSQTNILVGHLNLARSEAVKRNQDVKLCISNTAHSACTTTGQWEDGWMVFIDADNSNDFSAGDTQIQVSDALGGGNTVRSGQFTNIITYQSDGSVTATGTFVVCDQDGTLDQARAINISIAGHISIGEDNDGDYIPDDYANNEITSCT